MSRSSRRTSLPGLRRLPAVLALATIGLGLQALPAVAASAVPGCDAYWTGDADSTWDDAANWSDHEDSDGSDSFQVPGGADTACMAANPTTREIDSYSPVTVGTLRFGADDHLVFYASLEIAGATDSTVGLMHTFDSLTTAPGSTLNIASYLSAYGPVVAGGTVDLHGYSALLADVTGDVHIIGSGRMWLNYSGTQQVSGLVNDGSLVITDPGEVRPFPGQSGPTITNNGTLITNETGSGPATLEQVDNQGLIRSVGGTLQLPGLSNLADGVLHGPGTFDADGGSVDFGTPVVENRATLRTGTDGDFGTSLDDLALNAGTLDVGAALRIHSSLVNTGTVTVGSLLSAPDYTQTGGSTTGAGGTLESDVTVSGGSVGRSLFVNGTMVLESGATTRLFIDADGSTDAMTVSGPLAVGGTLQIDRDPSFVPQSSHAYQAVYGQLSGRFASIEGETATYYFWPLYTPSNLALSVTAQPTLAVQPDQSEVSEAAGSASFTVTLDGSRDVPVSVVWATQDGTAMAGTDYTASSGTATFQPGENAQTITVLVTDTAVVDGRRSFSVVLSNPVHGQLSSSQASASEVVSNDDSPSVSSVAGGPVPQGAKNQLLTVHGVGFRDATGVSFSRSGLKVVAGSLHVVDDGSLTVRVAAASTMVTGPIVVRVAIPDAAAGSCADCLSVVSRPVVGSTSLTVLGAGASHQTVTVSGSGFVDGVAVTVAGAVVHSTTFVSANQLQVTFSVPGTRAPGVALVKVTNPDGGSSMCRTCASFVAGPRLDSALGIAGRRSASQTVHLSGSGFADGLTLSGPAGVSFSDLVVSPTGITATMTVAATTRVAAGQKITVTNPASAGWGASTVALLTVCTKNATSCG